MLNVFGYITMFAGTIYYNMFLKDREFRTLLKYACFLGIFGSFTSLAFVLRWNISLGINDSLFIMTTDLVTGTLGLALTLLPIQVLFAKITPENIEGSCFAFLTGTLNFCSGILSPQVGNYINHYFVGVKSEDMSKFWVLVTISLVS